MWYRWWPSTMVAGLLVTMLGCNAEDNNLVGPRVRSSAALQTFESCADLEAELKANLKEEMRITLLSYGQNMWRWGVFGGMEDGNAVPASAEGAPRQEGVDFSGTNNQESGVDEADFVKTDGYHIYLLNGHRLEILGVPEFGQLTAESSTQLEGYPSAMLMNNDPLVEGDERAVVFSQLYPWEIPAEHPLHDVVAYDEYAGWYRISTLTKLTVLDLSDVLAPAVLRELYLEGYYQTARRIGSRVHMVNYAWMDIPGLQYWPQLPEEYYYLDWDDPRRLEMWSDAVAPLIVANNEVIDGLALADLLPQLYERLPDGSFTTLGFSDQQCQNFHTAADAMARGINSILSLDLLGDELAVDADHVIANYSVVYASRDVLLLAEQSQSWWWYWGNDDFEEATNIHRFALNEDGTATYSGSGRIDGLVNNQFSLDEHNGLVRVAATTGQWQRWWLEDPEQPNNFVYVLGGEQELMLRGSLGGIGVGEQIWSARFVDDKAFLVTFRLIDPLWTIDLSDPKRPRIAGELEVPGVSTYIHPFEGDSFLLTIGYGGDDSGLDWTTQVSLFDVTDFANPRPVDALSLVPANAADGWAWAWSEAAYEHKAFTYWGPMGLLAIPLSTYRYSYDSYGYYSWEYISKLQLVSVDTAAGLDLYGQVDHSDFFNSDPERWWDWRDVRRSIFMGDYIYAISSRGVTAHLVDGMVPSASHALPGEDLYPYWYW